MFVGVAVLVGVTVGVAVLDGVFVGVAVLVGVTVGVAVLDGVIDGVAWSCGWSRCISRGNCIAWSNRRCRGVA